MKGKIGVLAAAALGAAALFPACGTAEIEVLDVADGAAPAADARPLPEGGGTRADYCAGSGPPALVGADGGVVCAGDVAGSIFRFALCTCNGLVTNHALVTDAFDGSQGAYDPSRARAGASVGTNGGANSSAKVDVGGSLWLGDPTGYAASAPVTVRGELHAAGRVSGTSIAVGTDAWLQSGISTTGDLLVPGTVFLGPNATVSVGGARTVGNTVNAPVSVAPPCDCAPGLQLDVPAFVEAYRNANDDAAAGLDPRLFEDVSAPLAKTIPCGRFFFTRVAAHAKVELTVDGRAAIFVGGDFAAEADFVIHVPEGSELDFFVEGNVVASGQLRIGDPEAPARARTYVGGSGTVNLQNAAQLVGNLYAPRAELVLGGAAPATVFGAIFAARLSAGADLAVHFDESIARRGRECPGRSTCASCRDCGNQACISGQCAPCRDSSDCCAPSVCRSGTCVLDIR